MNRTELIQKLEAHLTEHQLVDDNVAPALKLMRQAYAELKRESVDNPQSAELLAQLASADRTISEQQDKIAEYENDLYDMLLQAGLLPDVDGEPAISFGVAFKLDPDCIEKLKNVITDSDVMADDSAQFISAVRNMLDYKEPSMQGLWEKLHSEAQRLNSLEQGIQQRDQQLQAADGVLNAIIEAAGADWQDVDDLPAVIKALVDAAKGNQPAKNEAKPLSGWVSDAIDLAHAVRGNLAPENRVMAKAAEHIILTAPQGEV